MRKDASQEMEILTLFLIFGIHWYYYRGIGDGSFAKKI